MAPDTGFMTYEPSIVLLRSRVDPKKIILREIRKHEKASEAYVDVEFIYPGNRWSGAIPYFYRRTGTFVSNDSEFVELINHIYKLLNPKNKEHWIRDQQEFWIKYNKKVTESFFEALKDGTWKCVNCQLPKNPNWARRVQDLKEFGYTIATNTRMYCNECRKNTTHLLLLQIPRGEQTGYEVITSELKNRIIKVLESYDAYEDSIRHSLLPDHKFPEIRWDSSTRSFDLEEMTDDEIKTKFQLLSNQRNLQKREVCRKCFQTKMRGYPFGIKYYYRGDEIWPIEIPNQGIEAEEGCIGCGWYDIKAWREHLREQLDR